MGSFWEISSVISIRSFVERDRRVRSVTTTVSSGRRNSSIDHRWIIKFRRSAIYIFFVTANSNGSMCKVEKMASNRFVGSISYKSCMSNKLPCRIIDIGSHFPFLCRFSVVTKHYTRIWGGTPFFVRRNPWETRA